LVGASSSSSSSLIISTDIAKALGWGGGDEEKGEGYVSTREARSYNWEQVAMNAQLLRKHSPVDVSGAVR